MGLFGGCNGGPGLLLSITYNANKFSGRFTGRGVRIVNISVDRRVLDVTERHSTRVKLSILCLYRGTRRLSLCNAISNIIYYLSDLGRVASCGGLYGTFSGVSLFLRPRYLFVFSIGARCGRHRVLNSGIFIDSGKGLCYI